LNVYKEKKRGHKVEVRKVINLLIAKPPQTESECAGKEEILVKVQKPGPLY
jgi:hypothetical protein